MWQGYIDPIADNKIAVGIRNQETGQEITGAKYSGDQHIYDASEAERCLEFVECRARIFNLFDDEHREMDKLLHQMGHSWAKMPDEKVAELGRRVTQYDRHSKPTHSNTGPEKGRLLRLMIEYLYRGAVDWMIKNGPQDGSGKSPYRFSKHFLRRYSAIEVLKHRTYFERGVATIHQVMSSARMEKYEWYCSKK